MAKPSSFTDVVLREACAALVPLQRIDTANALAGLLAHLGIALVPASLDVGWLAEAKEVAAKLVELLDGEWTLGRGVEAASVLRDAVTAFSTLSQQVSPLLAALGEEAVKIADELPVRLFDFLMIGRLDAVAPAVAAFLRLLTVIEDVEAEGQRYRKLRWDRLRTAITSPGQIAAVYGWPAAFDADRFLTRLGAFLAALGVGGGRYPQRADLAARFGAALPAPGGESRTELRFPLRTVGDWPRDYVQFGLNLSAVEGGLCALLYTTGAIGLDEVALGDILVANLQVAGLDGGIGLAAIPGRELEVFPDFLGAAPAPGPLDLHIAIASRPERDPLAVLLGIEGGARLTLGGIAFDAHAIKTAGAPVDVTVRLELRRLGLTLSEGGGADGSFLARILPHGPMEVTLQLSYSPRTGLSVGATGGLSRVIPLGFELGPLFVESVTLSLDLASAGGIGLDVSVTGSATLGPLALSVAGLGLAAALDLSGARAGGLGSADLDVAFKPPTAIALTIAASAVTGGGSLLFDPDKQQYAGSIHLEIAEKLSVQAYGLLTTRMPDGSSGYSLVILLATEFTPPIQLGYGFTLSGVGGIVGVNRTTAVDALRAGLRAGTLGSLLFPQDPARNALQIVSDLGTTFPPARDRYVFGPMVRLGWAGLISLDLAVILELPKPVRLILLGRLSVILPDAQTPVVRLQLDSLGTYDLASGDVALDAVLYDSEVAGFPVTGEMALRANFGAEPNFALAIGGFHPGFSAPAGFPALQRTTISLARGDNPRLRLAAYLAITTNTVQFGSSVDLYAKTGPFSIEGHLGFDVLIHFNPFALAADLGASLALKRGGDVLMSVQVNMSLTGPAPWHAWGKATFHLLFLSGSVHFDAQIGEPAPPTVPVAVALRPLLEDALKDPSSWAVPLPSDEHAIVALRQRTDMDGNLVLVHPLADLQVSQRLLPLGVEITRFGNAAPEAESKFSLSIAGILDDVEDVTGLFAPAQFLEMTDDEKLSAPAFARQQSGLRFSIRGFACGAAKQEPNMEYDEETQPPLTRQTGELHRVRASIASAHGVALARIAATGAAGRAPFRSTAASRYRAPPPGGRGVRFKLRPPGYVVDGLAINKQRTESFMAAAALAERDSRVRKNPEQGMIPAAVRHGGPAWKQITAISLSSDGHHRIAAVLWRHNGVGPEQMVQSSAVVSALRSRTSIYTYVDDVRTEVGIAVVNGVEHIRTHSDRSGKNNLLALPHFYVKHHSEGRGRT